MVIQQGSTATHVFNVPYAADEIQEVVVSYAQDGKEVLGKFVPYTDRVGHVVRVELSQADTLRLAAGKHVTIQMKLLLFTGGVIVSNPIATDVDGKPTIVTVGYNKKVLS